MFQVGGSISSGLLLLSLTSAIGRKSGETKMVKNGDVVEAHQVERAIS